MLPTVVQRRARFWRVGLVRWLSEAGAGALLSLRRLRHSAAGERTRSCLRALQNRRVHVSVMSASASWAGTCPRGHGQTPVLLPSDSEWCAWPTPFRYTSSIGVLLPPTPCPEDRYVPFCSTSRPCPPPPAVCLPKVKTPQMGPRHWSVIVPEGGPGMWITSRLRLLQQLWRERRRIKREKKQSHNDIVVANLKRTGWGKGRPSRSSTT